MIESRVQCCFCGKEVESNKVDPVSLIISLEDGGSQELWTHANCLREHLHESVPLSVLEDEYL